MKNFNELSKNQQEEVKTLIRLGDSEELAISTVLNKKEVNSEFYQAAYYS